MIKSNDFITIGTEEEIRGFQRKLDFSDDRIGMYYSALHPAYQDCVCEVIGDLIAGQDFFGYNFSQFLKSNKKAVTSVSQLLISRVLTDNSAEYLTKEEFEIFQYSGNEFQLNKQLDCAKKTQILKENTILSKYINVICQYFMIDIDLLKKGKGKYYVVKGELLEQINDDNAFQDEYRKKMEENWNTTLYFKQYENYLRKNGKISSSESIIEEYPAAITYSGAYLLLKQQKKKAAELKAINSLIMHLYYCQHIYKFTDTLSLDENSL